MRFHLNIVKRIRELCGEDFAIIIKLAGAERAVNATDILAGCSTGSSVVVIGGGSIGGGIIPCAVYDGYTVGNKL